jgi:hypothetical protein
MDHPVTKTEIEWHRLIDGDPNVTGWYLVAHRGSAKLVIFNKPRPNWNGTGMNVNGWTQDVKWATHWTKAPMAPDDGAPQLSKPLGKSTREDNDYYKALEGQAAAVQAIDYDSRGMPSIMWDK